MLEKSIQCRVTLAESGGSQSGLSAAVPPVRGGVTDLGDLVLVSDALYPGAQLQVGERPTSIALGDLDSDGILDAVTSNAISDSLSVLIGLGTLSELARNGDWLDPSRPSKVSRSWVYGMMVRSLPAAASNRLLRSWIGGLRRRVEQAL